MGRQRPINQIRLIVIHHSASNDSRTGIEDLIAERKRRNEGYNFIIDDDDALRDVMAGQDGKARFRQDAPDDEISNGTFGTNYVAWNVCIDGNFNLQAPTGDELETLIQVVAAKARRWGWTKADVQYIVGHQEAGLRFSSTRYFTECPGAHLIAKIPHIRERVASYLPAAQARQ